MSHIFIPSPFSSVTADAVIIGGGIVGAATAFYLSRAGFKTILIEKRDGLSSLTTAASAECFRAQFTEKSMADLALSSIETFARFPEAVGLPDLNIHLTQRGYLFVTDDASRIPDLEKAVAQYHANGVTTAECIRGPELHRRFGFLSPDAKAATYNQKDGWLSTHETTYGFAKGAGTHADFYMKTTVVGIQTDAQGVCAVVTDKGTIATRMVVNCAGPYAKIVGQMAGLDLPLRTVRRQKAYIRTSHPGLPANAPFVVDLENHAYWRPEAGGLLCAWVDSDEPESPPADELPTDWDFAAESIHRASRLNPFFEGVAENLTAADVAVSAGHYVYTPDDRPIIGPCPDVPGFFLNCGYWCGVMMSPAAGKLVADTAQGKIASADNPFRYTRFAEGPIEKGDTFLK